VGFDINYFYAYNVLKKHIREALKWKPQPLEIFRKTSLRSLEKSNPDKKSSSRPLYHFHANDLIITKADPFLFIKNQPDSLGRK